MKLIFARIKMVLRFVEFMNARFPFTTHTIHGIGTTAGIVVFGQDRSGDASRRSAQNSAQQRYRPDRSKNRKQCNRSDSRSDSCYNFHLVHELLLFVQPAPMRIVEKKRIRPAGTQAVPGIYNRLFAAVTFQPLEGSAASTPLFFPGIGSRAPRRPAVFQGQGVLIVKRCARGNITVRTLRRPQFPIRISPYVI